MGFLDSENRGVFWSQLHFSEALVHHMASELYISYATATTDATKATGISLRVAKHGARNVENGGPIALLRARLYATIRRNKIWPAQYPVEVEYVPATQGKSMLVDYAPSLTHTHTHRCACMHTGMHACIPICMVDRMHASHGLLILFLCPFFRLRRLPSVRSAAGCFRD